MKLSLNWVKQFTPVELDLERLIDIIGSRLGEIEDIIKLGDLYNGILVAKVISCEPHSNADKLSVCLIDDGGVAMDVERDENSYVRVVCGAPNVKVGMLVAWLPPGTVIPDSVTSNNPITLEAKTIRDIVSQGMLASAKELAIGDDHSGIVEIDAGVHPGTPFKNLYGLDDVIIEIENKMFTHRPDLFGELGLAREVAGITHHKFTSPDWYKENLNESATGNSLPLDIKNEIPDLVPRFCAQVVNDITIKPSPIEMQTYLSRVGIRPINNIVDITNYYMMVTAQPLHAYDYDKLKALEQSESNPTIVIRKPKDGETLNLLNGKRIKPTDNSILIATNSKPIGLGGIMGGAETEVDENTKNIILESANFDMYSVRRTSMELGISSEATTRLSKGQSPHQNKLILDKVISEIIKIAGGQTASPVYDIKKDLPENETISVDQQFIDERLGLGISSKEMADLLSNVEFEVESNNKLEVKAPFWRTDIKISEDIVEEVGRLYGFDRLKLKLPIKPIEPAMRNKMIDFKAQVRELLVRAGGSEVLTYSFIHSQLLEKVNQNPELAFQISNAISPDLQYYRLSMLPSLLDTTHMNIKARFDEFALFEFGKTHIKGLNDSDEPNLPSEAERLAIVFAVDDKLAKTDYSGAPYYQIYYYLNHLLSTLGIDFHVSTFKEKPSGDSVDQLLEPFEPIRSSLIFSGSDFLGVIGEPTSRVKNNLKLPKFCGMLELDISKLLGLSKLPKIKTPSHLPGVELDVCLKVSSDTSFQELSEIVVSELDKQSKDLVFEVTPVDIYQKEDTKEKQITFRIEMNPLAKTLTTPEANEVINKVGLAAKSALNAEVV